MTDILAERVLTLERALGGLQAELQAANARTAYGTGSPQVRIGRVTGAPTASDNTFDIIFDDGSYPETAGRQSPIFIARQSVARVVAYNLADVKIPTETRVPVWWWSDHWWTWWRESQTGQPTTSDITGFEQDFVTELYNLAEDEDRLVPFDDENLFGSITGLEWYDENDEKYFICDGGQYRMHLGFTMYPTDAIGSGYSQGYLQLEESLLQPDGTPTGVWRRISESWLNDGHIGRISGTSPEAGAMSTHSRNILFVPEDPVAVRVVAGKDAFYATRLVSVRYIAWHWERIQL